MDTSQFNERWQLSRGVNLMRWRTLKGTLVMFKYEGSVVKFPCLVVCHINEWRYFN